MYFTGGRLLEFERMMKESPGYKREPVIEAMKDQGFANSVYSGKCDKNRTKDRNKHGGRTMIAAAFLMLKKERQGENE